VTEIASLIERVSFVLKASVDSPARQTLAMGNVVWAALQRLESRTRKQGAAIVQPEAWPQVEGIASWLEVIWENLVANGLSHGGPTPRIELGWTRDSAEFSFRVRDNGLGVPPERRVQLFRPFDTLHELDAPRGLGLPIVQRLVELQGGRCIFESPAGGGACFIFTLPAAPG
jgi:signal transduction histidine kinase